MSDEQASNRASSQECRSFNRSALHGWAVAAPSLPLPLPSTCQVGRCRSVPSLPFPPSGGGEGEGEGHANQPTIPPSHFPHNRASEGRRSAAGELLSYSLGVGSGAFAGERGKEGEGGELQPFKMRRRRKDMLLSHSLANPKGASRMATPVFSYLIPSQNDGFLLAFLSLPL